MKKSPKKSFNISLLKKFTPLEIKRRKHLTIPYDNLSLTGFTPFEQKVYKAVLKIPKGKTRTYQWVAKKIGNPKAARGVGNALNKNPYPVIIPCHRIIRSDGSLGGYSRGLRLKNKLLQKEAKGLTK